ncbi:hypothetical protein CDIK_0275 [Cucumispora dikerogammari]|nr:hypothetical protein CDIK_0275 [Cucumispora dikerogammari]
MSLLSKPWKNFLVLCRIETTVNSSVVKKMMYSAIKKYVFDLNSMSLLISYAASYVLKAESEIKKKHKNIFHITCFAHLLHNCALRIKNYAKNIDFMISSVKMTLIKSIDKREKIVYIFLLAKPIIIIWKRWLKTLCILL